ncbi:MAG: MBL fold metallo-hydrolase [Gemmatimonadales bacterium]
MLKVIEHGPIDELRMTSAIGRLLGTKVSAFVHRGFLIDTGFPRASRALGRYLDRHPVRGVLVTHWHEDHSGNVPMLVSRGLPLAISDETVALMPKTLRLARYRRLVWGEAPPLTDRPTPLEHPFELIATPGHSPDHLAVWDPEQRVVFLGDLFLGVKACVVHRGEDPYAILNSVERVIALDPERAFCAHRGELQKPAEVLARKAAWLDWAIREVERLSDEDWPDRSIAFQTLGAEPMMSRVSSGEMAKRYFVESVALSLRAADQRALSQ